MRKPVDRMYEEESLILRLQELLAEAIDGAGLSKADVARRLYRHRSFVTGFLRHDGLSMTVANVAAVAWATGHRVVVGLEALPEGGAVKATTITR